ncbi:PadR family transcriptional regulator [Halomonas sp. BC04]|uniref:PadR family transcriptional regulator n=1 Tax=Halomonas sp. BC04 TaxID=1403540 RepID=UPI0005B85E59|nr:PadR family transcriptional regulator [Halomonas sp. BC04]
MEHHDLLAGLVRLHVLHHAAEHEIYGQWMIHELANHGYRLSPGTLYPMLHSMERKGYLTSRKAYQGSAHRRLYRATDLGREGLAVARRQLLELAGEAMNERTDTSQNDDKDPGR